MICLIQVEAQENGWLSSATISLLVLVHVIKKLSTATSIAVFSLTTLQSKAQEEVHIGVKSLLRRDANTFILKKSLEIYVFISNIV